MRRVRLAAKFSHRGDRPSYHPSRAVAPGSDEFEPLASAGSADLFSASLADGFLHFPAGRSEFEAGEDLEFLAMTPPL